MKAQMFNFNKWLNETDPAVLKDKFDNMLKEAGFNVLKYVEHHFEPFGFTSLYLLSESHFAIHTFPEENKSYIELSSCIREQYDNFKNLMDGVG